MVGFAATSGSHTSFPLMEATTQTWSSFHFVTSATWGTDAHSLYGFVANGLTDGNPVQVRFSCSGDNATGCIIQVLGVSSMTRFGANAVRQFAFELNQATSTTPNPLFAQATVSSNALLGAVALTSSPPVITPTASWIEAFDTGYATPSTGMETMYVSSGIVSTQIIWGSVCNAINCSLIVELDASEEAIQRMMGAMLQYYPR